MSSEQSPEKNVSRSYTRSYNSPVRQQQSAKTRQRIIDAGAELVYELSSWDDMKSLTFRAVGERAGVSERTVYRYFATEHQLKDAIVQNLITASGVDIDNLQLSNFGEVTANTFREISTYAASSKSDMDPTFASVDQRRRQALLAAVIEATPQWQAKEQKMVSAMLDMLWDIPPYQRLLSTWGLDTDSAIQSVTWLIGLIENAIAEGKKPTDI